MGDELRDGDDASLAWTLLFGLASSEPGTREELGDAVGGPIGGDLVDDVDEVDVRVDAGKLAVEQDGEDVRVALASVEAADEQRVLPERGHDAQQALDVGAGDREPAVLDLTGPADAIAALPADAHGWSGSDWRISVVGPHTCDTFKIGLIRGIGGGYFTREPWRDRLPAIGFSAPARAQYVPPSSDATTKGYETLLRAKAPLWVCDPYAEPSALAPLAAILPGGRLLTKQKRLRPDCITDAWARRHGLEVRVRSKLHDRFIVGSQHAFLIGTSLNSLGKNHSFLVELNAAMRATVREVFEELWNDAKPPDPPW